MLSAITLWNTVYLDAAITSLRADGYPVREEGVARLSLYVRRHLNVDGHYSFHSSCPSSPADGGRSETRQPRRGRLTRPPDTRPRAGGDLPWGPLGLAS